MEELQRFGVHTRQRKAHLTELGQKWLALHSGGGAPAYAMVANDYALVEARTHSPSLHTYLDPVNRAVDPASFVWITKNGYAHAKPLSEQDQKAWPHLAQMCETLWPAPRDQEAWQAWERTDHWKDRAYFLATMGSRMRPQFYGLVEAIYREGKSPSDDDRDNVSALYTKLQRYGAVAAHWPTPQEVGSLIGTLDLAHMESGGAECAEARRQYLEEKKQREAEEAARVEATVENVGVVALDAEPIPLARALAPAAQGPLLGISDFRRRHLIPPTFDERKAAKQIVLASMGVAVPSELMASAQRRALGTAVTPIEGECNNELISSLLNSVSHDQLVGELNLVSPALQTYYWSQRDCASLTAHDFVGRLISEYAAPAGVGSAFLKSYPTPDESLIKTILKL
jgi:hypothetical protein